MFSLSWDFRIPLNVNHLSNTSLHSRPGLQSAPHTHHAGLPALACPPCSSVFILTPLTLPCSVQFHLPHETSPAHAHHSVLRILLFLLQTLAPISVFNSSPVILCRSILPPQRAPYIWFNYLPARLSLTPVLGRVLRQLIDK